MDIFLCLVIIFVAAPRVIGGEIVCGALIAWAEGKQRYAEYLEDQAEKARLKAEKDEWKAMP